MMPTLSISAWQCLIDESDTFDTNVLAARLGAVRKAALSLGLRVSMEDAARAYDSAAKVFEDRYLSGTPISNTVRSQLILQSLGLKPDASHLDALTLDLEETHAANGLQITLEAKELLEAASKTYQIVLIGDTWMTPGRTIDALLDSTGLISAFHKRFYSDETSCHKINGTAFVKMAKALNVDPSDVTHVADHSLSDASGAAIAGIGRILFVERPHHPVPALPPEKRRELPNVFKYQSLREIQKDQFR